MWNLCENCTNLHIAVFQANIFNTTTASCNPNSFYDIRIQGSELVVGFGRHFFFFSIENRSTFFANIIFDNLNFWHTLIHCNYISMYKIQWFPSSRVIFGQNLTFYEPPSLKFQNRSDITTYLLTFQIWIIFPDQWRMKFKIHGWYFCEIHQIRL